MKLNKYMSPDDGLSSGGGSFDMFEDYGAPRNIPEIKKALCDGTLDNNKLMVIQKIGLLALFLNQVKSNLENIGIYNVSDEEILKLTESYEKKYNSKNEEMPSTSSTKSYIKIINEFGFEKIANQYPKLLNKNVVDIGSGTGGIPFEIKDSVEKIISIDPFYNTNDETKEYVLRIRNNSKLTKDAHSVEWGKNNFQSIDNLIVDSSYGEALNNIKNNTQDIVFINFVLSKSTCNALRTLSEASRVLKSGGKIFISDNSSDLEKKINDIGLDLKNFYRKENVFYCVLEKK